MDARCWLQALHVLPANGTSVQLASSSSRAVLGAWWRTASYNKDGDDELDLIRDGGTWSSGLRRHTDSVVTVIYSHNFATIPLVAGLEPSFYL